MEWVETFVFLTEKGTYLLICFGIPICAIFILKEKQQATNLN